MMGGEQYRVICEVRRYKGRYMPKVQLVTSQRDRIEVRYIGRGVVFLTQGPDLPLGQEYEA